MPLTNFTSSIDSAVRALLYTKFSTMLGLTDINIETAICPKGIAQRIIAEKAGKSVLPFINLYRDSIRTDWKRSRTVIARRGLSLISSDNSTSVTIKAVPIETNYNFWIWSNSLDKINECIEKYLFWQHELPQIFINYSVIDDDLPFDLHYGAATDESEIENLFTKGQLFCYRFPLQIDSWVFNTSTEYPINKIRIFFFDRDKLSDSECVAVAVEDSNQDVDKNDALKIYKEQYYKIVGIDAINKIFYVPNDRTDDFIIGQKIFVANSTANNGTYTITNISYNSDLLTALAVDEEIVSSIADGCIYINQSF